MTMIQPVEGERWRASYEGVVIPKEDHPSEGTWFALLGDNQREPEEFFAMGAGSGGWTYEKLAGTEIEELRARVAELEAELGRSRGGAG